MLTTELPKDDVINMIFTMITNNGLKKSALPDLLTLLRALMGPDENHEHNYLQSVYLLQKALNENREEHCNTEGDVKLHHFCEQCETLFSDDMSEDACAFCQHPWFDGNGKPLAFFMEMNPETQVQDFFRGEYVVVYFLFLDIRHYFISRRGPFVRYERIQATVTLIHNTCQYIYNYRCDN